MWTLVRVCDGSAVGGVGGVAVGCADLLFPRRDPPFSDQPTNKLNPPINPTQTINPIPPTKQIYATPCGPGRCIVHTTSANSLPRVTGADALRSIFKSPKMLLPLLMRCACVLCCIELRCVVWCCLGLPCVALGWVGRQRQLHHLHHRPNPTLTTTQPQL